AAEASKHLAKFKPDIATAQHQQVIRYRVQFHDRCRVQRWHTLQSTHCWLRWTCSRINKNGVSRQLPCLTVGQPNFYLLHSSEMRFAHQKVHTLSFFDAPLAAIAKTVYNVPFALPHLDHIDGYRASVYTIVSTS